MGKKIIVMFFLSCFLSSMVYAQDVVDCSKKRSPDRCFEEHFAECAPAKISMTLIAKYNYEIIGPSSYGAYCEVKSYYSNHPNPDIGKKEMFCELDNTRTFRQVQKDRSRCRGPLYDDLFKDMIDLTEPGSLEKGLKDLFSDVNITISTGDDVGFYVNDQGAFVEKTELDRGPFDPEKMFSDKSCQSFRDCEGTDYPVCFKNKCMHLNDKMSAYIRGQYSYCYELCLSCRSRAYQHVSHVSNYGTLNYCIECKEDEDCVDGYYCDKEACLPQAYRGYQSKY